MPRLFQVMPDQMTEVMMLIPILLLQRMPVMRYGCAYYLVILSRLSRAFVTMIDGVPWFTQPGLTGGFSPARHFGPPPWAFVDRITSVEELKVRM
jgi:hypothetical protein